MTWTDIGKKYFTKLFFGTMVHQRGSIPIYLVPFGKFCQGQIHHFTNSPFVIFNFFRNLRRFKKHGIALLISINPNSDGLFRGSFCGVGGVKITPSPSKTR